MPKHKKWCAKNIDKDFPCTCFTRIAKDSGIFDDYPELRALPPPADFGGSHSDIQYEGRLWILLRDTFMTLLLILAVAGIAAIAYTNF